MFFTVKPRMFAATIVVLFCFAAPVFCQVQPELSRFTPLDQQDLVDHFTGDFRYSVPLMEVPGPNGGYPIVLSYASGTTPDQDASWVGLGWTLSPGSIVRQMRGIPDEFGFTNSARTNADKITTVHDIEANVTYGLGIEGNYEIFGADTSVGTGLTAGLTGYFDNYRGFGITHSAGLSGQTKGEGTSAGIGLNISEDTLEGARVAATASLSLGDNFRFGADAGFDASRGLSALSFSAQAKYQSESYLVSTGNVLTYLGYAKPAALPGTQREMRGSNIKITFKMGGEVYGNYLNGIMFGYYNEEHVRTTSSATSAFGFLHLEDASVNDALDFNREKDGPIYDQSPNLALPILTHDLFVVSGRDIAGTFRAYRNDIPIVFDPKQESDMTGGAIGVDVGFGDFIKVGVSGALNHNSTTIQRWQDPGPGELVSKVGSAYSPDDSGYRERTYFKFIGEPSVAPGSIISVVPVSTAAAATAPIAPTLHDSGPDVTQVPPYFFTTSLPSNVAVKGPDQRVLRATVIQSFTNGDLRTMINALPELRRDNASLSADQYRLDHDNHIGAFIITTTNGTRYVYGIAVYNTAYEEHKFSVGRSLCPAADKPGDPPPPCVIVSPTPTATEGVCQPAYDYKVPGSQQMLEIKCLSPYPTSYLLTAILGPDYIDADDTPGPSDGDYGYWVKFNYIRDQDAQGKAQPFKWRLPFVGASFVRGPDNGRVVTGNERLSDMGYVTYGERESWYLASIETATHKAFMCVSRDARSDAISATGRAMNLSPAGGFIRPWELTGVKLYSKAVLAGQQVDPLTNCPAGVPLTEAHLSYDNSLAKKAPSAPDGKLTLKKVYLTHLDNSRGRLSPYTFDYVWHDPGPRGPLRGPNQNPLYADVNHDRWNSYRDSAVACGTAPSGGAPAPSPTPAMDEPATCQDNDAKVNEWSSVWTLRHIVEPSGRVLNVDYEADDYAFVQDKPATRFFRVVSVNAPLTEGSPSNPGGPSEICPVHSSSGPFWSSPGQSSPPCTASLNVTGLNTERPRIYFQLKEAIDPKNSACAPSCDAWIEQHYLEQTSQVFFKIRVALKNTGKWQTVTGYASVVHAGLVAPAANSGTSNLGWIELSPVHSNYPGSIDYHPFAHAAWQYLRLQQPELIHDGGINGGPAADAVEEAVRVLTLVDVIPDVIKMLTGVYPNWASDGFGQMLDLSNCWIRLVDPDGIKKGGGARVGRIRVSDSWNESTSKKESDLETGYVYSYRLEDGRSSGVASYEPMVGGEENPLRQAKPFTDQVLLSSNYNLFSELPIGESHYPSPSVGYSRVVRRSLAAQSDLDALKNNNYCVTGHNPIPRPTSVGPMIYEYYTARDFPVRFAESLIDERRPPIPQMLLIPLLGEVTTNSVTATQGYSTIVNDMHGKQKRETSYRYLKKIDCTNPGDPDYVVEQDPVKETDFHYRSTGGFGDGSLDLDNAMVANLTDDDVRDRSKDTVAEQSDFVVDLRQNRTESFDGGINLNVDTFLVLFYPLPIPVPIPNFGYSLSETKTAVTSRVVHRAGILDSITVREGSSKVTTQTDQYDPLTGSALMTLTDNAYAGSIYSYTMPARWTYARLGAGYEAVGRILDLTGATLNATTTRLTVSAPINICSEQPPSPGSPAQMPRCLAVGTELAVPSAAGGAHLTLLGQDASGTSFAIDGDTKAAPLKATVVRSGDRNLLSATTDTIRALSDPLSGREQRTFVRNDISCIETKIPNVLAAGHTTFQDVWDVSQEIPSVGSSRSDFALGARGIFRSHDDYTYLTERSQSPGLDLSKDGTFDFVLYGKGQSPATCEPGWLRQLTHAKYSAAGFTTESVNAISVPSAALYGLKGRVLSAVASNATQEEISFEDFEGSVITQLSGSMIQLGTLDISSSDTDPCFQCIALAPSVFITTEFSHTGHRSLRMTKPTFQQPQVKLIEGKRYLISAWVSLGKNGSPGTDLSTYGGHPGNPVGLRVLHKVIKNLLGPAVLIPVATFEPDGPIIDGWQRIEGTFVAPAGDLLLQYLTGNGNAGVSQPAYFDDIRIQPEDAKLEAFVYDFHTLRIIATLDENNFATLYRYTPDGKVDLVRRETVRGILAEQEGRMHVREHP